MRMSPTVRAVVTVLAFAAGTASATLAVVSPRTTFADDEESLRFSNQTQVGEVRVDALLKRDATLKSGWALVVEAENPTGEAQTCELKTVLERSFITPMARTPSEVTALLQRVESMSVPPRGKARVVREVPAWIAQQLATCEKMAKARAAELKRGEKDPSAYMSAVMTSPYPEFRVAIVEPNAKVARVRHEGGMMPTAPLPPARVADFGF